MLAIIFPGQGCQVPGMGKDFFDNFVVAKDVFNEADDALSCKLSDIIFNGPQDTLTLTQNAQPAIMVTSIAILRTLENLGFNWQDKSVCVAGHSLGEYTALCAAGALSLHDGVKVLRARGQAMQDCVETGQGAMFAIIGVEISIIENIIAECNLKGICEVANDNSNSQIIISGHKNSVNTVVEAIKLANKVKCVELSVSAPFHCSLMHEAEVQMTDKINNLNLNKPNIPIITNYLAEQVDTIIDIKKCLIKQIANKVRWRESIVKMNDLGVTKAIECGPNKILAGLIKNTCKSIVVNSICNVSNIDSFMNEWSKK